MVSKKVMIGGAVLVVLAGGAYALSASHTSASKNDFSLAMVSDEGGNISDHSFTEISWKGVKSWGESHDLKKGKGGYDYFLSKTQADFDTNFQQAQAAKFSMIAGIGFNLQNSLEKAAKQNPDTKYALVDAQANPKLKNVTSLMFKSEQSSYLAGVAAAMQAKAEGTDTIGFIGGQYGPVVGRFEYGFRQGVASVDKNMKVSSIYAASYSDAAKGTLIANTMMAKNIKVIFHVAGGVGNGAFTAVKSHNQALKSDQLAKEKVWMIGVDIDQTPQGAYKTADGKKDNFTLTSSLTEVGNGLKNAANDAMKDKFQGGKTVWYGIKDGGVGVITSNMPADEKKAVTADQKKIEDGSISLKYTGQYDAPKANRTSLTN
ncbi:BMP family ABC transporter substrate-binding protein [Weissella cibaria]|jgi:basic membrane protein A|uniref:BMP family ABC transporter substrate-binding protein n=1 Tax=Weissella cibaria TaxID=137591 RepID=A0A0D1M1Q2_9LACO|nr:BMP family protein [Weissella cibaria]APS28040.1 Membrane lipoprotein TmpC precursor [Weissella cibaria]APU63439.1 Membrane lipoprotein TmpC precursor [Weissella cibaria]APU65589.1 Membrane lipoprotein TmpC precursor [Weissella cibaria]ASS51034.1 Membrane lipoprotein TmpC [Weissella cibaria]AVO66366.1 BMP family ABC transporter substrate-binding protein [Weissella cibaria]